jgi:O-antigen/teichoic acid export membrane protein
LIFTSSYTIQEKLKSILLNPQIKNILFGLFFRFCAIACSFFIVPLLINQISAFQYGILITIISITTWFSFIDFGLANGLKNKISESLANNNKEDVKKYISTAYFTLFKVLSAIGVLVIIANFFVDWNSLIKGPKTEGASINILFFYGLLFFLCKILVELINPILLAFHKTALSSLIAFVYQFGILIGCYFLKINGSRSLLLYGFTFFWVPLLVLILYSIYFFTTSFKELRPSLKYVEKKYQKVLLQLGGSFFIIQIAVAIIFTTDNLIIGRVLGYTEVGKYNIAFRYFNIPLFVQSIILAPYWPLFGELYVKKDTERIKKIMNRLLYMWTLFALLAIAMLLFAKYVYYIWIGPSISIPFVLSLGMALFCIITGWNTIFATFINSTNKLKLQLYSAIISGLINIPLSVYFAKYTSLGVAGVIFGTCASLVASSVWAPIQYYKIINNRATGIWNK